MYEIINALRLLISSVENYQCSDPTDGIVDIKLPRGIGKTTAMLQLMTPEDLLVTANERSFEHISNLSRSLAEQMEGPRFDIQGRLRPPSRNIRRSPISELSVLLYDGNEFRTPRGCQPPNGMITRGRISAKIIYLDEVLMSERDYVSYEQHQGVVENMYRTEMSFFKRKLVDHLRCSIDPKDQPVFVFLGS